MIFLPEAKPLIEFHMCKIPEQPILFWKLPYHSYVKADPNTLI
jgi:hypothetical protein